MKLSDLLDLLDAHPSQYMHWMLPDNSFVPEHFHVTEVGRIQKDFIDCGGTQRSQVTCQLQLWTGDDIDHRIDTTKLAEIIRLGMQILKNNELAVEVEYEGTTTVRYPIELADVTPSGLLFTLGTNHTACLAPEKCGVNASGGCCEDESRQRILFVCIHNSARSQMAEAFVNQMCQTSFLASSAGIEPGSLNPLVVEVMQEIGIDISDALTTGVSDILQQGHRYDRVITVCDETNAERCPTFPGPVTREHWSFPDPSKVTGTHEEKLVEIRRIRDAIQLQISDWCRLSCLA
tara:strand:+ start:1736 stop:2608 length:873 start_codon:yes stop_codon:yes gene_type:complete